jgi:hypothetical protein
MHTTPPTIRYAKLVFASRQPGIVVTLINMHGDADAYTRHAATFPLTDAGRAEAEKLLRVLERLPVEMGEQCMYTREFLYEQLEEELEIPLDFLEKHLAELVTQDCTYPDYFAQPKAYMVDIYDEAGVARRAQFTDHYGGQAGLRCFGTLMASFYEEAAWPT